MESMEWAKSAISDQVFIFKHRLASGTDFMYTSLSAGTEPVENGNDQHGLFS